VLAFAVDGERYVLKIYRSASSAAFGALLDVSSRWFTAGSKNRAHPRERLISERDAIKAFNEAGFGTFDLLEQAGDDALLFRFEQGMPLHKRVAVDWPMNRLIEAVSRLATETARRQVRVLQTGDANLIHPDFRLCHVFSTDSGRLLYHDFEAPRRRSRSLPRMLADEVETFLADLIRTPAPDRAALCTAALQGLGGETLERWERAGQPVLARLSAARRRRRDAVGALVAGNVQPARAMMGGDRSDAGQA
jgi:hypothetical protein